MESYSLHVWCDLTAIGCKLQDGVHVHVFRKQALLKELTCVQIPIFYCCLHSCADNIYVNVEKKMGFVEIVDIQGERSGFKKYSSHLSVLSILPILQNMLNACVIVIPTAGDLV